MISPATAPVPSADAGPDVDALIAALRARIDDLDRSILEHIQERRVLSRQVQDTRVASGGVRIELSREREVLDTYARSLGKDGTALATAVLRTCRGPL